MCAVPVGVRCVSFGRGVVVVLEGDLDAEVE